MKDNIKKNYIRTDGILPQIATQIKSEESERKYVRKTLYSEILQKHRRSLFALGSFLRLLRNGKSNNYNVVKQENNSATASDPALASASISASASVD